MKQSQFPPWPQDEYSAGLLRCREFNQYTIKFQKGTEDSTAHAVSRLPLSEARAEPPTPAEVIYLMEYLDSSPVTSNQIRKRTEKDTVLAKVHQWIVSEWPHEVPENEA